MNKRIDGTFVHVAYTIITYKAHACVQYCKIMFLVCCVAYINGVCAFGQLPIIQQEKLCSHTTYGHCTLTIYECRTLRTIYIWFVKSESAYLNFVKYYVHLFAARAKCLIKNNNTFVTILFWSFYKYWQNYIGLRCTAQLAPANHIYLSDQLCN